MHQPTVSDFQHLKRILRYIKGTYTMGLTLNSNTDSTLRAFSDSDWAGCPTTRRSTGGYCTFLGNNLISWSAKRHPTVSRSSTEAEYRSLCLAAAEMAWMTSVLRDIGVPQPVVPELLCDNLSAVYLSATPTLHQRTKHMEVDYHYVRERVALGALLIKHIPASLQLADIFTKPLLRLPFIDLRFKLGVDVVTTSLRGAVEDKGMSKVKSLHDQEGFTTSKPLLYTKGLTHHQVTPTKKLSSNHLQDTSNCSNHLLDTHNRFTVLQYSKC